MLLRPLEAEDTDRMVQLLTNSTIAQTYMLPEYEDPKDALPQFRRMMELSHNPDRYIRAICLDGMLIGFVNDPEIHDATIEVGYVIDPAFHNQGYMTAALKIVIADLFAKGYNKIIAGAFTENPASIRVMEKCGMLPIEQTDMIEYRGKTHVCIYRCIQKPE